MDSFTQLTLGAAVGEAVLGRKVGRRAAFWGALCGTLPDLDVLFSKGDPVSDFTYHRGVSHSFFFMTLAIPLLVWFILRIHPNTRSHRLWWGLLVILAFYTHTLLDCFTVYGTQILLPFSNHPVTWSTVFIIDPAFTIPLLTGLMCALWMRRSSSLGNHLNSIGLAFACIYLIWTVGAKFYIDELAEKSLRRQNISYERLLSTPTPFNSLLWRIIVMENDGYYDGLYSLLDQSDKIRWRKFESQPELLEAISDQWAVQRLTWFSKGFYRVSKEKNKVVITDLRMGIVPYYAFRFAVGIINNDGVQSINVEQLPQETGNQVQQLRLLWWRIWDEQAPTHPG